MRADSEVLEAENTAAGRAGEGEKVVLEAPRVGARLRTQLGHPKAVDFALRSCGAFFGTKGFQMQLVGCFACFAVLD